MKHDQDNEEQSIFEAFLFANPQFAGELLCSWKLTAPNDPPDVICATESGKTVGVEIAQWAHALPGYAPCAFVFTQIFHRLASGFTTSSLPR